MRNDPGLGDLLAMLGNRSRPESRWVSKVVGCPIEDAEKAVAEVAAHRQVVVDMCQRIGRTGRTYYAQFPAPVELYAFTRLLRPSTIVESGVSSGVSSTFLLLGARENKKGTLHSIDLPAQREKRIGGAPWSLPEGLGAGWAIPSSLRRGWRLHRGRSEELLEPLLVRLGSVDLYCHDSPVDVEHFVFEMKTVSSRLRPGSLVVADNTDWGTFQETARNLGAEAFRRRGSSLGAFRVPGHGI